MTEKPLTLGDYRIIATILAGENSKAVKYFDDRIAKESPDERVLTPQSQMLFLLASLISD